MSEIHIRKQECPFCKRYEVKINAELKNDDTIYLYSKCGYCGKDIKTVGIDNLTNEKDVVIYQLK